MLSVFCCRREKSATAVGSKEQSLAEERVLGWGWKWARWTGGAGFGEILLNRLVGVPMACVLELSQAQWSVRLCVSRFRGASRCRYLARVPRRAVLYLYLLKRGGTTVNVTQISVLDSDTMMRSQ